MVKMTEVFTPTDDANTTYVDRLECATVLLSLAQHFAKTTGAPIDGLCMSLKQVEGKGLSITLCEDFPGPQFGDFYLVVDDMQADIKQRRMLSAYWYSDGRTCINQFRPGDWQKRLMILSPVASIAKVH
jgi:hypothetical protein